MPEPISLLIIDDSPEDREVYQRLLRKDAEQSYAIGEAETGGEGVQRAKAEAPDCIILDFNLPDMDALEVLSALAGAGRDLPCGVVLVTGQGSERIAVDSLKLGVHDYLTKGDITAEKIARAIAGAINAVATRKTAAAQRSELERMALYDPLTGLGNRNLFQARIQHTIAMVKRRGERACLAVIDLDGFKKVNDALGHKVGDDALREIGRRFAGVGRASDTIARLGGDEFAYIMETGATLEGAMTVANKIIQAVKQPIVTSASAFCIGVSIGIAMIEPTTASVEEIVNHADEAMYAAKQSGGGVRVYEGGRPPVATAMGFGRARRRA